MAMMRVILDKDNTIVNAVSSLLGDRTCLRYAADSNKAQLVNWLLDRKADTTIRDGVGETAWDMVNRNPAKKLEAFLAFVLREESKQLTRSASTDPNPRLGAWGAVELYYYRRASASTKLYPSKDSIRLLLSSEKRYICTSHIHSVLMTRTEMRFRRFCTHYLLIMTPSCKSRNASTRSCTYIVRQRLL